MSRYVMQIAEADTGAVVVSWPPRSVRLHGQAERDGAFIDALCARLTAKGVGVGSTAAHVCTDLREAWQELLHEMKAHV